MWDVVVVGAGPAGATAAIAALRARTEARVLLLDRARFPRDKACGDGIAPHAMDVLVSLGVRGLLDDRVPVRTLELARGSTGVTRDMRRPAWVVPRSVFDARLVDAATAAGAQLRTQRVRQVAIEHDRVVLDDGTQARVVVAADGAGSTLARAAGLPRPRRALALRGYAPTPRARKARQVIRFGSTSPPSYAWSFDRGDGWSNVGYGEVLVPGRAAPPRPRLVAALESLLPGATDGAQDWSGHHLPLAGRRLHHPGGRVLVAGDAAALVNPLSGEGIYCAVASGAAAGRLAVTHHGDGVGAAYGRALRRLLRSHLRSSALLSTLLGVPGAVDVGLRAAERDGRVFDDLVEIGLGPGRVTTRLAAGLVAALARGLAA